MTENAHPHDHPPLHARRAGVRNLEREIGSVCRKIARQVLKEGKQDAPASSVDGKHVYLVDAEAVRKYLGVERFRKQKREDADEIGLANGLAVTMHGGDLLACEVTVVPGKGKLVITGQLARACRSRRRRR